MFWVTAILASLAAWGGGSQASHGATPPVRAGSPKLTLELPHRLVFECRETGRRLTRGLLFCPPVVPRGPIDSQNNLKTTALGGGYELNFVSPSLAGLDPVQPAGQRRHLGHWRFAAGPPEKFRFALKAPGDRKSLRPVARFTVSGVSVDVYERRATAYDIDEGHVFALWNIAGRTYEMSVHGFENRPLVVAMTRGLVEEIVACDGSGDDPAPEGGICRLVFGPA
jgi:hypothetical protein